MHHICKSPTCQKEQSSSLSEPFSVSSLYPFFYGGVSSPGRYTDPSSEQQQHNTIQTPNLYSALHLHHFTNTLIAIPRFLSVR
jgi:hypothetical protein